MQKMLGLTLERIHHRPHLIEHVVHIDLCLRSALKILLPRLSVQSKARELRRISLFCYFRT